jgi:hypothetical protein
MAGNQINTEHDHGRKAWLPVNDGRVQFLEVVSPFAGWTHCRCRERDASRRLGRSLPDLIGLLGELQARNIDLYLHQQALDTSTDAIRDAGGVQGIQASDDPR